MATNQGVKYVPNPQSVDGRLGTGSNLVWPSIPGVKLVPRPGGADSAAVSVSGGGVTVPLTVSTTALAGAVSGTYYSDTLQAAGGVAPFTWTQTGGALPGGLTLSANGVVSGLLTEVDTSFSIVVQVTDALGSTASGTVTLATTGILPSDIPGLEAWWQSYDGPDASTVTTWTDKSGNSNSLVQPVPFNQPLLIPNQLNGKPAVVFDPTGPGQFMVCPSVSGGLAQPVTLYMLFKQITWSSNARICDGAGPDTFGVIQRSVTPTISFYANNTPLDNTDLAVDTWGILSIVGNGASSLIQIDNNAPVTGNAGNDTPVGFMLGALGGGGFFGNISVVEIILRSAADNADVRQLHIDYLARVGGLTI